MTKKKIETLKSEVDQAAILRQAVKNTSSSLEVLREAVSNSVDASAQHIDIKLDNVGGDLWNVVIQDDGHGMEKAHMQAFFNAGVSHKDYPQTAIGEKGLGSKTTFVAEQVFVESIRQHTGARITGVMVGPRVALDKHQIPEWQLDLSPSGESELAYPHGTRIALTNVRISSFNGQKAIDPNQVAQRTLHYLRSLCATGTVKNRFASCPHIIQSVMNVGTIPLLTVEVTMPNAPSANVGPEAGSFQVPQTNTAPKGGPKEEGVERNSMLFCDVIDRHRDKTITIDGKPRVLHYEVTAIIAGECVRKEMLEHELRQGWTQKSQMGVHFCKDFIPMRVDTAKARLLTEAEYYYEFKIFLNSQEFQLNADRNVITNEDHDEVSWIEGDFKTNVWPDIEAKYKVYRSMHDLEQDAIEASKRTAKVNELRRDYAKAANLKSKQRDLGFVKEPVREADVSHLLAMMLQSGKYTKKLNPLVKFGQYIDSSTDVICENKGGTDFLVEVEYRLPNLFRHKHPMQSYDYVVVWDVGNMSSGDTDSAPWGTNGALVQVTFIRDRSGARLQWGTHKKPVLILSEIV